MISTYLADILLDYVFDNIDVYVALSSTDPGVAGAGITEPTGIGSYARVTTSAADWTVAASRAIHNGNAITFPQATSGWGTAAYFALFDASSGGNFLWGGTINPNPVIIETDNQPSFAAADLIATIPSS